MDINIFERASAFKFDEDENGYCLRNGQGFFIEKHQMMSIIGNLQSFVDNGDWDEIENYNKETEKIRNEQADKWREEGKREKPLKLIKGFIYFIEDCNGNVKIGRSINTKKRFREYTKLAIEPITLNIIKSEDMIADENKYHDMFKNRHVRGEWFKLTNGEKEYIKSIIST